jgi:hypothetical protein
LPEGVEEYHKIPSQHSRDAGRDPIQSLQSSSPESYCYNPDVVMNLTSLEINALRDNSHATNPIFLIILKAAKLMKNILVIR